MPGPIGGCSGDDTPERRGQCFVHGDHLRVHRRRLYYHHGIYIDDGRVIEFSGPAGAGSKKNLARIRAVTLAKFEGRNAAVTVRHPRPFLFGLGFGLPTALPPDEIVTRAEWLCRHAPAGRYNLVGSNCEHLANWCVTGWYFESLQVRTWFAVEPTLWLALLFLSRGGSCVNDRAIVVNLLGELDAYRRRDPDRQLVAGQIDLATFLARTRMGLEEYLAAAANLRDRGVIAEPAVDQLGLRNGGAYLTTYGIEILRALRQELYAALEGSRPSLEDALGEVILRLWQDFQREGRWPEFRSIERSVTIALPPGTNIPRSVAGLPLWLGSVPIVGARTSLRVLGLALCIGADSAVVLEQF